MLKNCKKWLKAAVFAALMSIAPETYAQAVIFPQLEKPGVASLAFDEAKQEYTISNNLLSATFRKVNGQLNFGGCAAMDLQASPELFRVQLGDGSKTVTSSQMTLGSVTIHDLVGDPKRAKGSLRLDGQALEANYTYKEGDVDLTVVWRAVLRDGSHYLRTEMDITANNKDVKMFSIIPMRYTVDNSKNAEVPAVVGNTRGAVVLSDKIFAGLETPTAFNSVESKGAAIDMASFTPKSWNQNSFQWKPGTEVPDQIITNGAIDPSKKLTKDLVAGSRGYVKFYKQGATKITFTYKGNPHKLDIVGVDLLDKDGNIVAFDYHKGTAGGSHSNNVYTLNVPSTDVYLVRYFIDTATEEINSYGEISYDQKIAAADVKFVKNPQPAAAQRMSRAVAGTTLPENEVVSDPWNKDSWKALDFEMPFRIGEMGLKAEQVKYFDQKNVNIDRKGKLNIEVLYKEGAKRLDIAGVALIDANGKEAAYDFHKGSTGSQHNKNHYSMDINNPAKYTLRYYVYDMPADFNSTGVFNVNFEVKYVIELPAPEVSVIQGLWSRKVNLQAGKTWKVSSVVGLVAKDQKRRSILSYVERERAVPWRPYPIYNSWYELNINRNNDRNYDGNMHDYQCVEIVKEWQKQLYGAHGTGIKAFVWDDGWDIYGTWKFNKNFKNGFTEMDKLARQMDAGTGAWLGPVGGYGESGNYRRAYWNEAGRGGMLLSNPKYYKVFKEACDDLLNNLGYDFRYFKFDGISDLFSATGPKNSASGDEDAEGIIYAELDMRTLKEDVFFNTSVGTWASPFWFSITDAVWRQENDYGEAGNNSNTRENWITYRDRLVYQNFVQNSPMCPINNLMTHGFILSDFGPVSKDRTYDVIVREMRCAFACGSAMVELYNDFKLMNSIKDNNGKAGALWGELAKCIEWQEKNAAVLPDIHWVGGNPWDGTKCNVYGWAAWNGDNAVLTLRNGGNNAQEFKTTLRKALEIPAYVAQGTTITLNKGFADQKDLTGLKVGEAISIDKELTLTIPGSSVYVFDNTPEIVKPSYVVKNVSEINNRTAYTIKSVNRGYVTFNKTLDANYLSASFGDAGTVKDETPAENVADHQFAFVRTDLTPANQYFMYSIGAQKFVSPDGVKMHLTNEPVKAVTLNAVTNGADNNQFVVKFDGASVNLTINGNGAFHGLKVAGATPDEGNKMTIKAVNHKADLVAAQDKIDLFYKYQKLDRTGWKVTADSNHPDGKGGSPEKVIDGNTGTFWHNNYGDGGTGRGSFPYTMVFEMPEAKTFNSFGYLPRQDSDNGRVKEYILSVSADGENWSVVKSGSLNVNARNLCWEDLDKTVNAKFVKFTMASNQAGNSWACMSEFYLAYDGVSEVSPEVTGYPIFSTPGAAEWYYINFKTGGANLKDMGDNKKLQTAAKAKANEQKWVLIGNEYGFKLKSAAGRYITFKESRFHATSDVTKASDFVVIKHQKDNNYWELQQVGSSKCMNQFGGAGNDKELGEWNANDDNNPFSFKPVKLPEPDNMPVFCETTETANPTWYFLQFKNGLNVIADQGLNESARLAKAEPINGQLWKFVGNKAKFQLVNKDGRYLVVSNDKETNVGTQAPDNNHPLRTATSAYTPGFSLVATQNETYGPAWEIHANDNAFAGQNLNQHGAAEAGRTLSLWNANDNNNPMQFVAEADMDYADFKSTGITNYVPEHDLTLWYDMPSTVAPIYPHDRGYDTWMEYSLPLGDGQLGATFMGGIENDEIILNEKTVWSGATNVYGKYEIFGYLRAKYLGTDLGYTDDKAAKNYLRQLDLTTASGLVSFENQQGVKYNREYIVSNDAHVLAVRYTANEASKINLLFSLESGKAGDKGVHATTTYTGAEANFKGKMETVSYDARMKVVKVGDAGAVTTTPEGIKVTDADEVIVLFAGTTDYDPTSTTYISNTAGLAQKVQSTVNDAETAIKNSGWKAFFDRHVVAHQKFFNRMDFQLGATKNEIPTNEMIDAYDHGNGADALMLEKLYFAYGRYLEIASSQGVDLPNNLQGIWNGIVWPSWQSDIHANINVQMNYWPAEPTNLSEMHLPFLNYIKNMAKSAQWIKNATDSGQKEGWTCFTENNIFGGGGGFMHNYVIANAWYCTHLWQHYRYTLDKKYLKEVFPAMWTASRFWAGRLIKAKDNTYECPQEYSPEHGPGREDGVAHAQQLVWDLFDNTLNAIKVLGNEVPKDLVTDEKLADLQDKFKNLDKGLATEEYTGDWGAEKNGIKTGDKLLREWKYSKFTAGADGHRHMSHLMCLYPFSQVEPGTELHTAAVNSLKLRGDGATGWSMGWKINLWARALDGDHARTILNNALSHAVRSSGVYYNLYDAHAPFQIDGNFGACSGMAEMIMQSNEGIIRILPALPTAWKEGYMKGLKAVGDFTVDVVWAKNEAVSAKIISHKGSKLLVNHKNIASAEIFVNGNKTTATPVANKTNTVEIAANQGDVVTINFSKTMGCFEINTKEGFGTIYTDKAFTMPAGVEGTTIETVNVGDGNIGTLVANWDYKAGTQVPANTGLLLKAPKGVYVYNVLSETIASPAKNLLKGSLVDEQTAGVDCKFYKLSYDVEGANLGFYWGEEGGAAFQNKAGKAYLAVPAAKAASVQGFRLDDIVTGIEGVEAEENAVKAIYNLAGVRMNSELNQLPKGVYIVNGKKVIIK